jgi:hypothetical protein
MRDVSLKESKDVHSGGGSGGDGRRGDGRASGDGGGSTGRGDTRRNARRGGGTEAGVRASSDGDRGGSGGGTGVVGDGEGDLREAEDQNEKMKAYAGEGGLTEVPAGMLTVQVNWVAVVGCSPMVARMVPD